MTLSKKLLLNVLGGCAIIAPIATISCSNSLESRLESLLNDPNVIDLEINFEAIKEITKKEKVDLKDLFITNTQTIKIKESEQLITWNKNLSNEDINSFLVEPKISAIVFPDFVSENDNKISELQIIIDVSAGHLQNKTIEKKLQLNNLNDFNNEIIKGKNNYFDWTSINNSDNVNEPIINDLYKVLKNNILKVLKDKKLVNKDNWNNSSTLNSVLSFSFTSDKTNIYQSNLHCSFGEKNNNLLFINIYTNKSQLSGESLDNLKNTQISLKISYNYSDLI